MQNHTHCKNGGAMTTSFMHGGTKKSGSNFLKKCRLLKISSKKLLPKISE